MLEGHDPHGSLVGATLGSYRVTDRIGAGGMGVVYRAKDLRLDRTVAVKALPELAGSDPVARKKLMDEARRGSRVTSPYVATVFDVVEQDERAYIVMEHIDGRRLDDVLRQDKPDLARVTGFAVEIAEALTAIHGAGLVHRDLKPANVMVTPAGHVKVMDFGLARENAAALLAAGSSESTQSTQTHPGQIAGTILYMSPEQLKGVPLDARSDLFSFGTLLYEAVIGKHPFARETLLASASAILHEPPAGRADPQPMASSPVVAVVDRLLEKDRDRRYASAKVVLEDLLAVQSGLPVSPSLKPRARSLRAVVMAVAFAAIVVAGYTFWPFRPPQNPEGRPVLAVLPFEDRTGEPQGDLRAELLTDLIATNLTESSLVRALPLDRVRQSLSGLDAHAAESERFAAMTKAADVRWIVAGTIYADGSALYAMVRVYRRGESQPSNSFRVNGGATAAIAELASATLRERLFPDRKDAVSADATGRSGESTSEAAQLLDVEAKRDFRDRRFGAAVDKLDKAVRLDPGFLAAQVHLADVLDRAGFATRAGDTADRALRTLEQLGDTAKGGTLALEARAVHARVHGNADAEIAARRALVALHGDDPSLHVALANALESRGRSTEALPELDLAIALDPKDPGAQLAKARVLGKARRYDDAVAAFDRAGLLFRESGSTVGDATVLRARADFEYSRARYPESEALYQRAAPVFAAAGLDMLAAQSRHGAGNCELMLGHLDAAVAIFQPVLAAARSAGDHRLIVKTLASLGGQYIVRGNPEEAEKVLRQARDEASRLENPRLLAGPTLNLASVLSTLGRAGESRPLAEEALTMARSSEDYEVQSKALLLLANANYLEGRLDDAIRSYRDVLQSEPLATAPGTPLGNVHLGLAELLREAGQLKAAADSADAAVSVNRLANNRALLGYSLVARARVRADLMLDAGAEQDLDEATKLASQPGAPLADVLRRVGLGRAANAMRRGKWDDAERELAALRANPGTASDPRHDSPLLVLSAEVAVARGRSQDAVRFARDVVDDETASAVDRATSRVDLARAEALAGNRAAAATLAGRGLDEAERIGMPVVVATASAFLVDLAEGGDTESIRARGTTALARYLDAAPDDRREPIRQRSDLRAIIRSLEPTPGTRD